MRIKIFRFPPQIFHFSKIKIFFSKTTTTSSPHTESTKTSGSGGVGGYPVFLCTTTRCFMKNPSFWVDTKRVLFYSGINTHILTPHKRKFSVKNMFLTHCNFGLVPKYCKILFLECFAKHFCKMTSHSHFFMYHNDVKMT
jgi:hypothetical protein